MPRSRDPAIAALRQRVHVSGGPGDERARPAPAARARHGDAEGRPHRARDARESHRGDFNEPFAEAELREKFRELAGHVLDAGGA